MKPNSRKVSVHVDVTVDGTPVTESDQFRKAPLRRVALRNLQPFSIASPGKDSAIQVTQTGGVNFIPANGSSIASNGQYPIVYALAYPDPSINPLDPAYWTPPSSGAASTTTGTTGGWGFGGGNLVPGAAAANSPTGPANSTLLIWYEYWIQLDDSTWEPEFTVEAVCFRGYTGGSMPAPMPMLAAHLPAAKLAVAFHGALGALGTIHLAWNGVSWVGMSPHRGGVIITLTQHDTTYQLLASGPATNFVVAGPASSFRPFNWHAEGSAFGAVAGSFKVTITE